LDDDIDVVVVGFQLLSNIDYGVVDGKSARDGSFSFGLLVLP